MPKIQSWTEQDWKEQLLSRLDRARQYREQFEGQWRENASIMQNISGREENQFNISFDNIIELESGEVDNGDSKIAVNEIFKYVRFWHSQMSANPPSVIVRPTSPDPGDRRKADAGDRIARHLRKELTIQEVSDERNNNTLIYGTGYSKVCWNPDIGDMVDVNEQTEEVNLTGDHEMYAPLVENVWLDPDANRKKDLRWTIERHFMLVEDAVFKFPEHEEHIRELTAARDRHEYNKIIDTESQSDISGKVEVLEYFEKGLPINGGVGRHAWFLADGTLLEYGKNPHYSHGLPIKVLTYIDVPGQIYGKSVIEYTSRIQDMLQRMDSSTLDAIQAHGVVRMAIHEATDIEDEALSNSNWDYIKYGGSAPPHFINPPQIMPDIWQLRDVLAMAIKDLFGINDSMLGIQKREQSAVSQQTSIESGTMIHRRLMTKFAMSTEEEFRDLLGICRTKWDTPRQVLVLGKEKAFEAADFSSADIEGGFDLEVEYGTSLPLDPNMAREQLMLLMPALKEAGVSMKEILRRFRLNEVESVLDIMELASDRQREIFEEMVAKVSEGVAEYIAPQDMEEHQGMLEYAYIYRMSSEFKYLDPEAQALIEQHIREREQILTQQQTPQAPAGPGVQQLPGSPGVSGAITPDVAMAPPAAVPEEEIM
jgi:hypothetical protein